MVLAFYKSVRKRFAQRPGSPVPYIELDGRLGLNLDCGACCFLLQHLNKSRVGHPYPESAFDMDAFTLSSDIGDIPIRNLGHIALEAARAARTVQPETFSCFWVIGAIRFFVELTQGSLLCRFVTLRPPPECAPCLTLIIGIISEKIKSALRRAGVGYDAGGNPLDRVCLDCCCGQKQP